MEKIALPYTRGYITLCTNDKYIYGLIGLIQSWKNTDSKYDFYVLMTPEVSEETRRIATELGYKILNCDETSIASHLVGTQFEGEPCWWKLDVFRQTQFSKLVYIDADSIICRNMDHLFEAPAGSSVRDWLTNTNFCAGFMVVEPNAKLYNRFMFDLLHTDKHYDSQDQGYLNELFSDWFDHKELVLPHYTHFNIGILSEPDPRYTDYIHQNLFTNVLAFHITGAKPWDAGRNGAEWAYEEWAYYKAIYKYYTDFVNWCVRKLSEDGICQLETIN